MTDNVIPETAFYRAIVQTTIYKWFQYFEKEFAPKSLPISSQDQSLCLTWAITIKKQIIEAKTVGRSVGQIGSQSDTEQWTGLYFFVNACRKDMQIFCSVKGLSCPSQTKKNEYKTYQATSISLKSNRIQQRSQAGDARAVEAYNALMQEPDKNPYCLCMWNQSRVGGSRKGSQSSFCSLSLSSE